MMHVPWFRFGCMHLLATNLNLWLHIVVKESIVEIDHAQHEDDEGGHKLRFDSDDDGPPSCDGLNSEILGLETISEINIYLYPFAIEFALIGAILFFTMYRKVGYM